MKRMLQFVHIERGCIDEIDKMKQILHLIKVIDTSSSMWIVIKGLCVRVTMPTKVPRASGVDRSPTGGAAPRNWSGSEVCLFFSTDTRLFWYFADIRHLRAMKAPGRQPVSRETSCLKTDCNQLPTIPATGCRVGFGHQC